jgi:hypothetical protein
MKGGHPGMELGQQHCGCQGRDKEIGLLEVLIAGMGGLNPLSVISQVPPTAGWQGLWPQRVLPTSTGLCPQS